MVWFNVDDTLAFHPKAIQAGNAALGLWVRAGSWSAQTLSDGFVPRQIARSLGTVGQCKALVVAGLWHEVDGGYRFHEWEQRQQTKEDVESRREMERKRKADQRRRKNVPPGQPPDSQPDNPQDSRRDSPGESQQESAQESSRESADPIPSYPFPSSFSGAVRGDSPVGSAREKQPPRDHPGHPRFVEGCADCERIHADYEDWVFERLDHPPRAHCPAHPGGTSEPCGGCREARRDRERWERARARAEARKRSDAVHRAAEDRARAAANCGLCDERGYVGMVLCDHDPETAERARRGLARARIAACRMCDADGLRADGSECDHKPPRRTESPRAAPSSARDAPGPPESTSQPDPTLTEESRAHA